MLTDAGGCMIARRFQGSRSGRDAWSPQNHGKEARGRTARQ
jgi:hypothetical protein